jgi:hypothetical protein
LSLILFDRLMARARAGVAHIARWIELKTHAARTGW